MDDSARLDRGGSKPQAIIQRMQMTGVRLAQSAVIDIASKFFRKLILRQQRIATISERFIILGPFLQMRHVLWFWNAVQIAPAQITFNFMQSHAIGNQRLCLFSHVKAALCISLAQLRIERTLTG